MIRNTNIRLPGRSARYGVGKSIGGCIYVHHRYEDTLGSGIALARSRIPPFDYTVVKLNERTGTITFIQSPDFDTAPEPVVGASWSVTSEGKVTFRPPPADPFIYHHKWLMVAEDYPGFSAAESRQRSLAWINLPGVDRSRIGRRSYWTGVVLPQLARYSPLTMPGTGECAL